MASRIVTRTFADGTTKTFRRKKQGRHPLPDELKKTRKNLTLSKQGYALACAKAKSMNMSVSAFYDLAGTLYDIYDIGVYNNCSTQ